MFFVDEREEMAVSWRISVFQKMPCWNPYFYSVLGCALFGQVVKRGEILDTHQKNKKLTDNWKAPFCWYFCVCFFFVFFPFLSLLLVEKTCFPPRKGHFLFIFECLPLFLLSLSWPPPFSICLALSLSLSLLFFSFFPLVFLFCFLLVPCFCLFLCFSVFFAFVSWKEQHQNIQLQFFFINPFFFLVSCLAFSFKSLSLIFVFSPDF